MKLYILSGHFDWEGGGVLGVYSSADKAKKAEQDHRYAVDYNEALRYDHYDIEEYVLDSVDF